MGRKFLDQDHPEYQYLYYLVQNGKKVNITEEEFKWILKKAQERYLNDINGVGILTPQYDAKKIFKRQMLGLLGEYAVYKIAIEKNLKVESNFDRNLNKADIVIENNPLGIKTCVWDNHGYPMTPQIDVEELKKNPIPQAIVYVNFDNNHILNFGDLTYDIAEKHLKLDWVIILGVLNAYTIINGVDKDYGVGTNTRKSGFVNFSSAVKEICPHK